LYVRDDSAFNEAFASTVEQVGVERWLSSQGDRQGLRAWQLRRRREQQLIELLLAVRGRLGNLYAQQLEVAAAREGKAAELRRLEQEYRALKDAWGGYAGFDPWMRSAPWNNARLATVATYFDLVPAFLQLLDQQQGDLAGFYAACRDLGRLDSAARVRRLQALARQGQ
jgi:predicted aminopeptidase